MLYRKLIDHAKSILQHLDNPALEGAVLLAHIVGMKDWRQLMLLENIDIDQRQLNQFDQLLKRRAKYEPIAYIIGNKEFWSLEFEVSPDALIPRPETELIIESVQDYFKQDGYNILDLGTGSGCLPITLLTIYPKSYAVGLDISPAALAVAKKNAIKHLVDHRLDFQQSNWLESLPSKKFDIIVANPPYIPIADMPALSKDVALYEPNLALTDKADGLSHYRTILQSLAGYMHNETIAFFEFGINQADPIRQLLVDLGYSLITTKHDLAGIERCVAFKIKISQIA
jgi:release factor glutamine methyltransferase